MSYAVSRPLFNKFVGGVDIAASLRTHLQANGSNLKVERFRTVSNAVAAASRIHPITLERIMRRVRLLTLDMVN
jgi:hypothetical protein